jgi:2-polyprenyl-3-methyl-5-hydroxy-6-metoxy-1,4-benzoquinol methylase
MEEQLMSSPYSHSNYDPNNQNTTWHKIIGFVPPGSSVLDVGCSAGGLGEALKSLKNAVVTGIDINDSDVKIAKTKLDSAFVLDVEGQPTDKLGLYDVIIFADVLEHMKDPILVLTKIKKHLKPKGRIIFSLPNMAHIFTRLELLNGSFRYTETGLLDYTHLHFYDELEVRRIFAEAQLTIKDFDCPVFDYPDELIKEKVEKVGLKTTKKFLENAHKPDATFFEYVGYADLSAKSTKVAVKTTSPLDEVYSFVARKEAVSQSELKQLKEKVKLSEAHIQKLEAELAHLQAHSGLIKTAVNKVYKRK